MPALSRLFVGSSSRSKSGSWMSAYARRAAPVGRRRSLDDLLVRRMRFTTSSTASILGSMSYTFSAKTLSKKARTLRSRFRLRGITWRAIAIVSAVRLDLLLSGLELAGDESEDGALACAILAHERYLAPLSHSEKSTSSRMG